MLRINLLEDPQAHPDASAAPSGASTLLISLVGALVILLCVGVALAGWLTITPQVESAQAQEQQLLVDAEPAEPKVQGPNYKGLVQLERDALTLQALQEQQAHANEAVQALLEAVAIDGSRRKILAVSSIQFDGQTLVAEGRARRISDLEDLLTTLQADEHLVDARFTRLQAADAPLSGKARARSLNAIDFTFYAALAATPVPEPAP